MVYIDELNKKIPDFLRSREEYKILIQIIKKNNINSDADLIKLVKEQREESKQSLKEEKQTGSVIGSISALRRSFAVKLGVLNFIKKEILRYLK